MNNTMLFTLNPNILDGRNSIGLFRSAGTPRLSPLKAVEAPATQSVTELLEEPSQQRSSEGTLRRPGRGRSIAVRVGFSLFLIVIAITCCGANRIAVSRERARSDREILARERERAMAVRANQTLAACLAVQAAQEHKNAMYIQAVSRPATQRTHAQVRGGAGLVYGQPSADNQTFALPAVRRPHGTRRVSPAPTAGKAKAPFKHSWEYSNIHNN